MLLAVDVGNTHTVFGIYRGDALVADWRVSSTLQQTEDEAGAHVKLLLAESGLGPRDVTSVGISSVVPNLTDVFAAMARRWFSVEPVIDSTLDLGITIHYTNPRSVGADRLCNAVAGFAKHGGPLIIIDFGTATTYDVVASEPGQPQEAGSITLSGVLDYTRQDFPYGEDTDLEGWRVQWISLNELKSKTAEKGVTLKALREKVKKP